MIASDIFCFGHCEAVGGDGESTSFVVMRWVRTGERSSAIRRRTRRRDGVYSGAHTYQKAVSLRVIRRRISAIRVCAGTEWRGRETTSIYFAYSLRIVRFISVGG